MSLAARLGALGASSRLAQTFNPKSPQWALSDEDYYRRRAGQLLGRRPTLWVFDHCDSSPGQFASSNVGSGNVGVQANDPNGVYLFDTGATAGSRAMYIRGYAGATYSQHLVSGASAYMACRVRILVALTSTETIGVCLQASASGGGALCWLLGAYGGSSTVNWSVTNNGTTFNTGVPFVLSTYAILEILNLGGSQFVYVNGALVATTTAVPPNLNGTLGFVCTNAAIATARQANCDWMALAA